MTIRVIAPAATELPAVEGAEVVRYKTAAEAVSALTGTSHAVLVSDALPAEDLSRMAEAIRSGGVTVVEVHSERWDGETHSPLTAACRGVIGGFGTGAVRYAVELLNGE